MYTKWDTSCDAVGQAALTFRSTLRLSKFGALGHKTMAKPDAEDGEKRPKECSSEIVQKRLVKNILTRIREGRRLA